MNPAAPSPFSLSEIWWRGIILALSLTVLLFSVWCLTHGITTIFMHLYYFPIVLLAYRYRWKGLGLASLLSLAYLGLVIIFDNGQPEIILGAFYRFLVFVGIAAVISYLSVCLAKAQSTMQQSAELRDRYLSLAPAIVLALDKNGVITFLSRHGGEILECRPDDAVGKSWFDQFLPEKERERVKQVFSQMMAGLVEQNRIIENQVLTCGGAEKIIRWHNTVLHDNEGAISGILGSGEDITEEKWRQDSLNKMQQFQESVITNANVWISVLEPDGTLLVWNDAAEAISGYKKTGVLGKRTVWKQLYPDNEYRKKVTGDIQRIIRRDTFLENFETEIRCADGTKKIIVWNTRGQRDTKGNITSYIAIGRDITAQKSAEFRAGESTRFLATMIDTLPIPVFFKDTNGKYLGCNTPFEEYIGIKRDQLTGKTAYDIAPMELADRYTVADRQILDNPLSQRYETQVQYADGSRHDVIFYKAPFFNNDGSVGGLIGAYLDISERKIAEEALKESELFNRGLVENLPDYIAVYGQDGKLLYVNPSSAKALGYDADTLVGTHVLTYIAEEYHDTVKAKMAIRQKEGDAAPYEIDMITRDGLRRSVIVKATPLQYRNNPAILLLLIDITERKKAEEEIRISNVILKTQQETSPDGILIVDKYGKILSFNRRFTEIWGIPLKIIDSRNDEHVLSFVLDKLANPQEFLSRVRYLYEHLEEKSREEIVLKDGNVIERYSAPMLGEDNRYFGRVWYFHDITERKKAEDVIRSREEQFRVIFHNQQTGLIMVDAVTHTIIDANAAALAMIGASQEDVIGKVCHTFICPAEKGKCPVSDLGQTVDNSERVLIRANGEKIPILKSVNPIKIGGRPFLIESFVDLTESKQMEMQIRESRQLFADIISFLPDPTFVIDKNGLVLAWNRALEQLSGVSAGDIIGKGDHEYSLWQYGKRRPILIDLVLHPDQDAGRMDYNGIHWEGNTVTAQTQIVRPGRGNTISLSLVASPLIDYQGNITGAIESIRDISRLREAEAELVRINAHLEKIVEDRTEELTESERKYRTLFDKTRDALLIIENNKFVDCNAAALQMLGYNTKDELFETHPSRISPPTQPDGRLSFEKAEEMMAIALRDGSHRFEWVHRRANGEDFWVEVSLTAIPIQDHQIIHTAWRDITDRKKAEASIQASLEEKVILLREIHHRVKNNLQIIISLVNLQMRQTDDPIVKQIMSETQNRIRAMSLVHEKLYRSASLSKIDFSDYTRYLATQLSSFYGSDTRRVRLDFGMGKIMVDINTAVPLGLLMNELISNALKHAFPNGREGTISISGGYEGDLITLVVRDNGIGIPADFDWKNTTSLGMRLVTSLIDQVDGTIVLDRSQGTAFTITIKREPVSGGTE